MTKLFPLLLLALCGCSELDNCPDEREGELEGGLENGTTDVEARIYSSAPWEGPRDPFPAKTMMRFPHGLETTPEVVVSYVSFAAEGYDVSENAGSQGRIRCVDNTDIWIKNDTCEESFYIRVAAWASGTTDTACSCETQFAGGCETD